MAAAPGIFSPQGRLSRRPYWMVLIGALTAKVVVVHALAQWPAWRPYLNSDWLLIFVAAAVGKRMRDFGWPAIWGWLAVAFFLFAVPFTVILILQTQLSPTGSQHGAPVWIGFVSGLPFLLLAVLVGIKKGDPGPNRFGDTSSRTELAEPD